MSGVGRLSHVYHTGVVIGLPPCVLDIHPPQSHARSQTPLHVLHKILTRKQYKMTSEYPNGFLTSAG